MRTEHLGSISLLILLLTSLIASLIPITIFSVGAVDAGSVTIASVGEWENLTDVPEGAGGNNGHRIEAMGDHIYYWVANTNGFYRYHPDANAWEILPSAPHYSSYGTGIVAANDTACNPAIYIIAGTTYDIRGFYRYTPHNNSWVTLNGGIPWTNCQQRKPRNGSEFVWDGEDRIYYFPGSGYSYNQYDWYEYKISTDTWSFMGLIPGSGGANPKNGPGNSACLVTLGDEKYIYIQFGTTGTSTYTGAEFWRYQISNGQWTKMAQTGYGADDGADVVWDGGDYLYLSPGAYKESSAGYCNEYLFFRYSISGNTWVELMQQPFNGDVGDTYNGNDDGGSAGLVGEYIYRFKGGDGSGGQHAKNFYRYHIPAPKTIAWATGPTGSTNNPNVTLTYNYTLCPDSVKLYYLDLTDTLGWDPFENLRPTHDAQVRESAPTTNYGDQYNMYVGVENTNTRERSYLKFDLASIPPESTITSATLGLVSKYGPSHPPDYTDDNIWIQAMSVSDDSWTELGITWNNAPAPGAMLDNVYVISDSWVPQYSRWYWDVTSFVTGEFAGDKVASFCMMSKDEEEMPEYNTVWFYQKDGGNPDERQPWLEVITEDGWMSWTLAGEDTSVDGTFDYSITSGDGTYGWTAVAIGGGSTEDDPPFPGTPPEAASLILDTSPNLLVPANGSWTNDNTPTFEWSCWHNPSYGTYQIQIGNQTPVGYWQMDEGSGTTTADNSGNGNTGTLENGPTWVDGKFGKCLNFDGIDDYVSVPDDDSLDITGNFTLMAWINPQDDGIIQYIVSKEDEEFGYFMYRNSTDNKVWVGFNGGLTEVVSTTSVLADSWYHVAGVWDGSNIKIYINGVLDNSTEGEGNPTANNWPLTIGRFWEGAHYKGAIDEVAVYNRALSDSEIAAIYNDPDFTQPAYFVGGIEETTPQMGYWQMDEGSGTTTADNSGNGNIGTLENGPTWVDGKFGKCLNFDGINDYVSVPDDSSLDFTNAMTVMAWVKLDDIMSTQTVADKGGYVDGEFAPWSFGYFRYDSYWNNFYFRFREDSGSVYSSTVPTAGTWYHVAATYDGAYTKLYVNGVLEGAEDWSDPIEATDYPLYIGCGSSEGAPVSNYFGGAIDEVAVYNRALSASEIAAISKNEYSYSYTLPDENALAAGTYFWRVRAVDSAENAGNWSTSSELSVIDENRWEQTSWVGGPTNPFATLQVETWDEYYHHFYDSYIINWLDGVSLENYIKYGETDHLVISEFATRGELSAYDEFVELYNPTSSPIDIGGWKLEYWNGSYYTAICTIPYGATIPAHGFYLWGNNRGYSGPTPDLSTYGGGFYDGPTGSPRGIRLKMPDDVTVIDTVVYEGAGNTYNAQAEGGRTAPNAATPPNSVERKAQMTSTVSSMGPGGADEYLGNSCDSNNNYDDWLRRITRNPQNSSSTEIPSENMMINPVTLFKLDGWLESSIYDTGNIADWKIISWIEDKPSGTSIIVEARTGKDNNPYDGGWSGWYQHSNGAENSLMENGRWAQYRVELSTTDNSKTPKLSQIWLDHELVSENIRDVYVSISPSALGGVNGATRIYTVTVTNAGNVSDTYTLDNTDNVGWAKSLSNTSLVLPAFSSDNTTTLSVTIPMGAAIGTIDNITVTANGTGVSDSASCTAQVVSFGELLTIENPELEGYPSQLLKYTIDVQNSGNVLDDIYLSYIPDGWPEIYIDQTVFNNVEPSEHRQATMFVYVPDNALPCTYKEITVLAESLFCGSADNENAIAHVTEMPATTYTYVSSYSAVKGTVTNFANQQSADDGGAYSTLAERGIFKDSGLYYFEDFEHGGQIPPGWAFTEYFHIMDTSTGNHTPDGGFSAGVTAGDPGTVHCVISDLFDYTALYDLHLSFWYRCTATAVGTQLRVDASIDGGATYTVPVVPLFTCYADTYFHKVFANQDLISSLVGQSNVRFKWTYYRTGGYFNMDDITFTATRAETYDMEIYEDITHLPSVYNHPPEIRHTLEMRYKLANTSDTFNVQVWDGSAWKTRGGVLDSLSPQMGYWQMDEGSGTTTADNSGNGNTGTLENGPTWVDGKFGKCLNFDGIDDYVSVPDANSLDITGNFTLMAWINPQDDGIIQHILSKEDEEFGYFMYRNSTDNKVRVGFNGGLTEVVSTTSVLAGYWYHVAGVWDGSNIKIYINGVLDNSTEGAGNPTAHNWPLTIGRFWEGAHYKGAIDEVAVYNRALSASEISAIYNNPPLPNWVYWSYMLLDSEIISDTVQVRFVDVNPNSIQQNNILKEYLRVKNEIVPPYCEVDVVIENQVLEGYPSQVLAYTIDVYNKGNVADNFMLSYIPNGWDNIIIDQSTFIDVLPGENRQTTMSVTVPYGAEPCTYKEIIVTAESQFCHATDNDNALAHVITCGVDVTIENKLLEGYENQVLAYTIKVHNSGSVVDNFNLSYIPDGWDNISIYPSEFIDIPPGDNGQAMMLVTVPYGAEPCTYKEIIVTAESQFCHATDNDNAMAHVIPIPTCGVEVTIENTLLEGKPSEWLEYTISVHNSGEITDNLNLGFVQDGWPDISIDPTVLIDVQPCETRQAKLYVHVPDGTLPCTYKEIIVTAESQFCHTTDNDNAMAHVTVGRRVNVTISPSAREALLGENLIYDFVVKNTGNVPDNYILELTEALGWPHGWDPVENIEIAPGDNWTSCIWVVVSGSPGTKDTLAVKATSVGDPMVSDIGLCTAYSAVCGVEVTIENKLLEGYENQVLVYTIEVHNSGNIVDNFNLTVLPDGWDNIRIDTPVLIDVLPGENRQTTMSVTVPDGKVPCTYKEIIVVAESQFCGAQDNDNALAHVTGIPVMPATTYTYVSSYSAVKGTVTNFANQQSADDGGAYSTLAERGIFKDSGLYWAENFEHGGFIPPMWTFTCNFMIKDMGSMNHTPGGGYSAGVTKGDGVSYLISDRIDYTEVLNPRLSFWYRGTAATYGTKLKVDASIDGGVIYSVPVVPEFICENDSTFHQVLNTQDLSSLVGQSNVKFKWTYTRTGGYFSIDDIQFATPPDPVYDMEIHENITGIPPADNHTLEMRYKLVNTNDTFNVEVWDGSAWNTRGADLTSTSWTDWSYILLDNEVISGTVQVRFIDDNENSTPQDIILKDYLRVKNENQPYCGVEVVIENALLEGWPNHVLKCTIYLQNSGNVFDNIYLSYIPDGWDNISIYPSEFIDVPPREWRQAKLYVHVPDNAVPCTYKDITVVAESQLCDAQDNYTVTVHVVEPPPCWAEVIIENKLLEGRPCEWLEYTISVHNSGNIVDDISLTVVPDGWPMENIYLDQSVFNDVQPCEWRQAKLYVHVPDNAVPCTKEITVVAESEFCQVTDSDSAQAHVVGVRGVEVTISPSAREGQLDENLFYDVVVKNTGNVPDTYDLDLTEAFGWPYGLDPVENLRPTHDAQVRESNPATNYGDQYNMYVGVETTLTKERSYLKFDLASIPSGSIITSATLSLRTRYGPSHPPSYTDDNMWIQSMSVSDDSWTELGITWNNAPAPGAMLDNVYVISDSWAPEYSRWYWDATSFVAGEFAGDKVASFCMMSKDEEEMPEYNTVWFYQKDGGNPDDRQPWLEVIFTPSQTEEIAPWDNWTGRLWVVVSGSPCTMDTLTVTATSVGDPMVSDSDNAQAHATELRRVDVTISPSAREGMLGENLFYDVVVKNTGNVPDNYDLDLTEALGWPFGWVENAPPIQDPQVRVDNLRPTHDAQVRERYPTTNYGNQYNMYVGVETTLTKERSYLKFDLASIPIGSTITSANLSLVSRYGPSHPPSYTDDNMWIQAMSVSDDSWTELEINWDNAPAPGAMLDNVYVIADSWVPEYSRWYWDVTSFVASEYAGDKVASFCMMSQDEEDRPEYNTVWFHQKDGSNPDGRQPWLEVIFEPKQTGEIAPWDNWTGCITVVVSGSPCTTDTLTVMATSFEYPMVSDSDNAQAHAAEACGVEVIIENKFIEGMSGKDIETLISVHNSGVATDNIILSVVPDGWPGIYIDPSELIIAPAEWGQATLYVHVPDGAEKCTYKEITVVAESQNCHFTDNDNAMVHVIGSRVVDVTISPSAREGMLGENLFYDVVVKNTGDVPDNYILALTEALGWPFGWDPVENLRPTHDAQVRQSDPTTNYGNQYNMYVGMEETITKERSYLKFDLASIPSESVIVSATLSLSTKYGPSHPPDYIDDNMWIQAMSVSDDSWTELGINWSNAPAPGAMLDNVYVISDSWVPQYSRWYWDVTSFVTSEFAGDKVASFCMMSKDEEDRPEYNTVWFYQKDGDNPDDIQPWLEVIWVPTQTEEIAPGDNFTSCIWVVVSGSPCTIDTLTVTATSVGDLTVSDSANAQAHAIEACGVDVTISPSAREGMLGENLFYDVVVKNTGSVTDDYILDLTETLGWPHGWDPVENLRPTHDAQVRESYPTTNYGDQYNMYVGVENTLTKERSYLKFDLASIPSKSTITSATLSLSTKYGPSHPPSYTDDNMWIQAMSVSDDSWTELGINWSNAPAPGAMLDNVYVISDSWVPQYTRWYWDVTSFVTSEFAGDKVASFCMMSKDEEEMPEYNTVWFYQKDGGNSDDIQPWLEVIWEPTQTEEIEPGDNFTSCIWVVVSGSPCTIDTLTVTATSVGDLTVSDSANAQAHAIEACGVEVTIENKFLEGLSCEWLEYTISVHNSGEIVDNIILSFVEDGWPGIYIDPPVLIDVQPDEWKQATLYVHVPDSALQCTYKEIIVTAESQICGAQDNDNAQAHVRAVGNVVIFSLVNLYTVNVEKILDINEGSKLVVKFYTYGDAYEGENVIETFVPPVHVEENEKARHPGGTGVKNARLDLTTDDTENVISTIASFTVCKLDLAIRFSEIPAEWLLAQTPEEKLALAIEFSEVPAYWLLAPD